MERGLLRVYLGAFPGVGKTYAMLSEGRRRRERGTDVVIGLVETHGRPAIEAQLGELEIVQPRSVLHGHRQVLEMDHDAVLQRAPRVVLVDDLAHTNAPGSVYARRWEQIEALRDRGITVICTVNIGHLESLRDVVGEITGVLEGDTVPDVVVRSADQIELVDMSPEALRRRMAHGHIYPPDQVDVALANYFAPGNLMALRELALLWVAGRVEDELQEYRERHGIDRRWETRERVLVALSGVPGGEHLVRRSARMARRAGGDLVGVHVTSHDGLAARETSCLKAQRCLLAELGGTYREVLGADVPDALLRVARAERATQIVIGKSPTPWWRRLGQRSVMTRVLAQSGRTVDVHVISAPEHRSVVEPIAGPRETAHFAHVFGRSATGPLSGRRMASGMLASVAGILLLTMVVYAYRAPLAIDSLLYLLPVLIGAVIGGTASGLVAALASFLALDWFFVPPVHSLTIASTTDMLTLAMFLVVGGVISAEVNIGARRAMSAQRARRYTGALARATASLLESDDPVPVLIEEIRRVFDVSGISVLRSEERGWLCEVVSGVDPPGSPDDATLSLSVDGDRVLALRSSQLRADDREALDAFVSQIGVALEGRQLRLRAAEATSLANANELRTALLAAVSHDLRTPLASIRTATTSLLSGDVVFDPGTSRALLETIDVEAERLSVLVANLLDMSRLHAGAFPVHLESVGLDEMVNAVLVSLPVTGRRVLVEVSDTLPPVDADPPLLERALWNLVANAVKASELESPIRIMAALVVGNWVELRIVDRGPGIAPLDRERVFVPFQRLGDQSTGNGVGLGLAVAKGFVEAMGGELLLDDTPGGGLTVIVRLRTAEPPVVDIDIRPAPQAGSMGVDDSVSPGEHSRRSGSVSDDEHHHGAEPGDEGSGSRDPYPAHR